MLGRSAACPFVLRVILLRHWLAGLLSVMALAGSAWGPAFASTGCDAANNGDFDQSAGLVSIDLNIGGDFDDGDVLHVAVNADTLLFVFTLLPSTEIYLWVGANSADYTIPATASYSFNVVLTAVPLGNATLTITCTEAVVDDGGDDGGDDPPSTAAEVLVDRLLAAGNQMDSLDSVLGDLPRTQSDIRRAFLERELTKLEQRVAGLQLLLAVAPDAPDGLAQLAEARARLAVVLRELGATEPTATPAPLAFAEAPATTGAISASSPVFAVFRRRGSVRPYDEHRLGRIDVARIS